MTVAVQSTYNSAESILAAVAAGTLPVDQATALLQAMAATKSAKLTLKISAGGGVSVYGLQRMPTTLYASQWESLFGFIGDIKAFIAANKPNLSTGKDDTRFEASKAAAKAKWESAKTGGSTAAPAAKASEPANPAVTTYLLWDDQAIAIGPFQSGIMAKSFSKGFPPGSVLATADHPAWVDIKEIAILPEDTDAVRKAFA
jgi:hypothetical protein